ncbi:glycosyltransferase family 2 protein, partial [bacterium]|nr:glycosyltransferase family 2 protein [bacterium]
EVGLADEDMIFADDDELNWRIVKAGHKILMNPEIKFLYYPRHSIPALFKQYFGYGRGRAMAVKKHPDRLSIKHLIPSAFVLLLSIGLVLSLTIHGLWIPYVSLLGLYAALSLFSSARIAAREGWRLFPVLPVLFFTIHVSYGLGFLRELIAGHRPPVPIEPENPR